MAAQAHNDWNERIALAQQMLPLLGQLHRNNNVVTSVFGRLLVNVSDVDNHQVASLRPDISPNTNFHWKKHCPLCRNWWP